MIEKIHFNLEKSAEELKDSLSKKIYTEEEIRSIVKKRKNFEYRISRPQKKLSDFLKYLEYELSLDSEKQLKNKKDLRNVKRIIEIFKSALKHFFDERLFVQFIDFLEENECFEEMKDYFGKVCLLRVNDSELWLFCGTKLFEVKEVTCGRLLFQKGLRVHNSFNFYKEYFLVEFMHFTNLLQINKEIGIESLETELEDGAVLLVLFNEIYKLFGDKEDLTELVSLFSDYELLKKEIDKIMHK